MPESILRYSSSELHSQRFSTTQWMKGLPQAPDHRNFPLTDVKPSSQHNEWAYEPMAPAEKHDSYHSDDYNDAEANTPYVSVAAIWFTSMVSYMRNIFAPKHHPLSRAYEAPPVTLFFFHASLCLITYPVLSVTARYATSQTIFWARVVVGIGCNIMGFFLSITLVGIAGNLVEAAAWAVLIDQSMMKHGAQSGIRLKEFCFQVDEAKGIIGAFMLLYRCWRDRKYKNSYSGHRFWAGYVILFAFSAMLAATVSFILGRAVDITAVTKRQESSERSIEVLVDLSDDDMTRAEQYRSKLGNLTWNTDSLFMRDILPRSISYNASGYGTTTYFAEVTRGQLRSDIQDPGFGAFRWVESTIRATGSASETGTHNATDNSENTNMILNGGTYTSIPRWGIRTVCEKIPDLDQNMIISSKNNFTYLFVPRAVVLKLYNVLFWFQEYVPAMVNQQINVTATMYGDDVPPSTLNVSSILMGVRYSNNGQASSVNTTVVGPIDDDFGLQTIETVLIRLNSTYAPNAAFGFKGPISLNAKGEPTYIGYDATACLQVLDQWDTSVYMDSTGPPRTLTGADNSSSIYSIPVPRFDSKSLNISRASQIILWQVKTDNNRELPYAPSQSIISYANDDDPWLLQYTNFSTTSYALGRSRSDAINVLPYLSGSGSMIGYFTEDVVITQADVRPFDLIMALALIFMTGLLCTIAIPRLPMGAPRRRFNLGSWILAFYAKEVEIEGGERIVPGMSLEELQEQAGDAILRYRVLSDREKSVDIEA
ncbi:hypothetical protein BJ165DRAFT_1599306 [Panaeolus papilionaceus]|nr:hypothetical protein BJ165DRAFT_1599306 [Panaeolus papilionaceus]